MPPAIQLMTTFSGGIAATSSQPDAARALLDYMASAETAGIKHDNGMEPA
jgi:molybdate transport system substrate-binding protein